MDKGPTEQPESHPAPAPENVPAGDGKSKEAAGDPAAAAPSAEASRPAAGSPAAAAASKPRLEDLTFSNEKSPPKEVLIVASSSEPLREACLEFLQKIGLKPILSNIGTEAAKSMEQKLVDHPEIKFAVGLLSADELVYSKNGKPADARLRLKQDAVFQLGYLVGRFGRQNVFLLYREQKNFLLPTDFTHAIYIPQDHAGFWQKELRKRLQAAGYTVAS